MSEPGGPAGPGADVFPALRARLGELEHALARAEHDEDWAPVMRAAPEIGAACRSLIARSAGTGRPASPAIIAAVLAQLGEVAVRVQARRDELLRALESSRRERRALRAYCAGERE